MIARQQFFQLALVACVYFSRAFLGSAVDGQRTAQEIDMDGARCCLQGNEAVNITIQTIKMYGDGTALFCRHQHIDSIFTVHFQIAQFADKRRQPANVSQQETGKIKLVTQIPENPSAHVATSRVYPPVISPRTPARKIPSD